MPHELEEPEPAGKHHTVRLTRCSSCGYSLRGLSLGDTCPECGQQLVLRAWVSLAGRLFWQRVLALCVLVALALLLYLTFKLISTASSSWAIAACLGTLAILAVAGVIVLRRLSRPQMKHDIELIVSVHGFTAQPRRGHPIHASWRSLGAVEMSRDLSGLRLLTLSARPRRWLPPTSVSFTIDSAQVDAEALRALIERLIAESGGRGGSPVRGIVRGPCRLICA